MTREHLTAYTHYFDSLSTPFYFYDMDLLRKTLTAVLSAASDPRWHVHYAVKACATREVLRQIASAGLGADCVSGGEIEAAIEAGFKPEKIVFAGVAKQDWEIELALRSDIYCLNIESVEELKVVDQLAHRVGKTARVCLRVNPNIDAHTDAHITTGLPQNKFGIPLEDIEMVVQKMKQMQGVELLGLHFHIGSQILDFEPYRQLCTTITTLLAQLEQHGIRLQVINVGGGLGIDYEHPDENPIPDFVKYFSVFRSALNLRDDQELHFELGRSIVGQCGSLLTRVLHVKHTRERQFVIVDAGMTDLLRPALYHALHQIENISNKDAAPTTYDIVGPICESSDVFATNYLLSTPKRGDMLVLKSAGAYGEIMASQYNLRRLPGHVTSDDFKQIKELL